MDALLRQRYLRAMGIQQWVPRLNLPGAPESRLCELPPGVRIRDSQKRLADQFPLVEEPCIKKPSEKPLAPAGGASKTGKSERQGIAARLNLDLDSGLAGSRDGRGWQAKARQPALPDETALLVPSPSWSSVLSFSLVICRLADGELLVAELPAGSGELRIPVRNYLKDLAFALGYQNSVQWLDSLFRWPMVDNPHVDQQDGAACEALLAALQTHQARPISRIITLGKVPARVLADTDKDFDEIRGTPQKVRGIQAQLLATHGVTSVFEQPTLKAQVWMDLATAVVRR